MRSDAPGSSKVPGYVWKALAGCLVAIGGYYARDLQRPQVPDAPRSVSVPEAPPREPTTDPHEIRVRLVEDEQKRIAREWNDRVAVLEARVCLLEQEVRDANARIVKLSAGRQSAAARSAFERDSKQWATCPLRMDALQQRTSLREAIPEQWR